MSTSGIRWIALGMACAGMGWSATGAAADGKVNLDLRLRYEQVQQDNALRDADALTLRTRLGYASAPWRGVSAFAEFEHVAAWVDDYAPEQPGYSVIADPAGSELNQAVLRYDGVPGFGAMLGRSRLILDNGRWVGNVGWRQNEQTFDGVFLRGSASSQRTAQYAQLRRINTVLGTHEDLDAHLLNLAWAPSPALNASAYAYLLDYDAAAATDSDTYGLRLGGHFMPGDGPQLRYAAEYARQRAQVPGQDYAVDYLAAELGASFGMLTITLGHERLGSDDGAYAVQTPLGTRHAFQGWADVFLVTPADGVRDHWLGLDLTYRKLKLALRHHRLHADARSSDYGDEFDASASAPLWRTLGVTVKLARYRAENFGVDTDKLWLQLDYRL
jgi:hypothetical protein